MQDLRRQREALHAAVQGNAGVGEDAVGQRMLAEQAALGDVHQQPETPGGEEADLARLLDAPVEDDQRDEVGHQPYHPAGPRQQIGQQRRHQGQDDEAGFDRQQQFLGCHRARGHQAFPFFFFGAGSAGLSSGRSGRSGCSPRTRTWVPVPGPARGLQLMPANR